MSDDKCTCAEWEARITAMHHHVDQQAALLIQQQATIAALTETLRVLIDQQGTLAAAAAKPAPRRRVRKPKPKPEPQSRIPQ